MREPVDVLAVMDCAAETLVRMKGAEANTRLVHVQRDALTEARAAVAELIEKSAAALHYMRLHQYADQAWADDLAAALAAVGAQQPAAVDRARFRKAPCYLCGYNGAGYFQPETHPCAALYHAAQPGGVE